MPTPKTVIILTVIIFAVLSAIYTLRLNQPETLVWDEQYHVPAAQSYRIGEKQFYLNRRNPPLGKEAIALSIHFLGNTHIAHRLPSALAAAALGALLFLTATCLVGYWEGGLLALLLWLSSTLALLHARLAMLDMMTSLFFFAAVAAFLPVLRKPSTSQAARWLHLACLLAAIAGAVKAIGFLLFPLFFLGLIASRKNYPLRSSLPSLFFATFWTIPLVLMLSYGALGIFPLEIPNEFRRMFALQEFHHKDFNGLSSWYQWFIGQGELWYLSKPGPEGRRFAALCIQNPILFGLGSIAEFFLIFRAILRRLALEIFLGLLIPAQIVFWILFKDQTILSYALPMVPVFCLIVPYTLSLYAKKMPHYRLWAICIATASSVFFWKAFPEILGSFIP